MSDSHRKLPLKVVSVTVLKAGEIQPNYVVLLYQSDIQKVLPIVVDGFVAYAIDVALRGVKTARPLTHDLLKTILDAYQIDVEEVIISDFKDKIYYATIVCRNKEGEIKEFDSRASDAIAIALRTGAPIYTYEFILEEAGMSPIHVQEGASEKSEPPMAQVRKKKKIRLEDITPEILQEMDTEEIRRLLDEAVKKELYEIAALLRDELNRRQNN